MALIRLNRDLRVDFFRGLALWWIFTDHVPGDVLGDFSLRNVTLCDATEIFVLLAGYAAGIAYGRTLDRQGWLYAGADAVRRAWNLYVAHIFLFVVFSAQVAYSAAALDRSEYLDEIHLDVLGDNPYRALLEALTLHFQPAYLNILPLYVVLLLLFALALPLLRRPRLLLGLSFALYAVARLGGFNLPSWTGGGWFFNPLTWQLLFMLGAVGSYAPGKPPRRLRVLDTFAGLVLIAGLLVIMLWQHPAVAALLPQQLLHLLYGIDKVGLHPFRLISILALAWLTRRLVPEHAAWLRGRLAWAFVVTGQHSLPVFCSGIFLAFVGRVALEQHDTWSVQLAVNVLGALALAGVGALAAWYGNRGGGRARSDALPVATNPDTA